MDGKSLTPQEIKLQQLKEILPEAYAEGKIDWEKLKATLGEDINFTNERYVLNWAGKSEAFKVLQTPTTKTLVPDKKESVNFDQTEHIFIEGENLEVLKVLQKSYFGKIKMIYIDPPYNRKRLKPSKSDEFNYNDKFNHSTWLTFMKNRLIQAKELLSKPETILVLEDLTGFFLLGFSSPIKVAISFLNLPISSNNIA
jgi:adenine-specific DNA-methyltransferase